MKQVFFITLILFVVASCTKEIGEDKKGINYFGEIKVSLKDSLSVSDYNNLDFSKAVLSKAEDSQLYFLRIPFSLGTIANHFVLIKTSKTGQIHRGKIVHLKGGPEANEIGVGWYGTVSISSLNRNSVLNSAVTNGYIEAIHKYDLQTRLNSMLAPDELPEIIVVAYTGGMSYSYWACLENFFYQSIDYDSGVASYSNYYGFLSGGSGDGNMYNDGADPNEGYFVEPLMLVDKDTYANKVGIEIKNYVKCFDAIPDAGATCSIEIFADIPVDSDPTKLFDFNSGSPGHTFIQLKKSNGGKSVIQNIGFYPKSGWKVMLTNAPLDGKFVDDGQHEFNASFKMSLSPEDMRSTLTEVLYLANFIKYDIDDYNCTDFALNVFNKTRSNKLVIPLYNIPGSYPALGTSTPQGLYNKLKEMKKANSSESANINIGIVKGWVATSGGPCN